VESGYDAITGLHASVKNAR